MHILELIAVTVEEFHLAKLKFYHSESAEHANINQSFFLHNQFRATNTNYLLVCNEVFTTCPSRWDSLRTCCTCFFSGLQSFQSSWKPLRSLFSCRKLTRDQFRATDTRSLEITSVVTATSTPRPSLSQTCRAAKLQTIALVKLPSSPLRHLWMYTKYRAVALTGSGCFWKSKSTFRSKLFWYSLYN